MDIHFREPNLKDVRSMVQLFKALNDEGAEVSFSEVKKEQEIRDWLKEDSVHMYVAIVDDKPVGVFRGKQGKEGREHSCFLTAAVEQRYRGYKVGENLTNYALEKLKDKGMKIARAYVYSNNPASIATLLKCGFSLSGSVHMHHLDKAKNRYVDDLIFHKIL